jgi:putative acetyltransferase
MIVRKYNSKDCKDIVELFHDTVHSINSKDYAEIQLNAWAPEDMDLLDWDSKLTNNYSIVVEKDGDIIGFGVADNTGYFDCLYTHKDYQGIGVATLIANDIEKYIHNLGIQTVTTAASITAKPFFEKRGYIVLEEQFVECRGEYFINFRMKKDFINKSKS